LPLTNTPEVFGLHTNAEIGYYTNAAKDMWSCLIDLQPQTGDSGAGVSREAHIDKVSYQPPLNTTSLVARLSRSVPCWVGSLKISK